MEQPTIVIIALLTAVMVISAAMIFVGAIWDHNGLFQGGLDVFKVIVGAVVGVVSSLFVQNQRRDKGTK
jgi:hypothetical protein